MLHSATQLITCASPGGPKRGAAMQELGLITDGAVAVADGKIVAVGQTVALCAAFSARQSIDAAGKVVCPGFVDCHTHLVFAGERVNE